MKRFIFGILAMGMFVASANAQDKKNDSGSNSSNRWYVYWATWEEWGHLPDCTGWGLCNYSDCWFCDENKKYKGEVKIDVSTRKGYLYITLDPSEAIQAEAIKTKSNFTIVDDIDNKNSYLQKGIYTFDSKIGAYGGYKINITLK